MDRITKRQADIIHYIEKNGIITGKGSCSSLNVSLRTIQYEIKELNKRFNMIDSSRNGYSLNSNYYNQNYVIEENYDEIHSILTRLIVSEEKILVDDLIEEYYLSSTTMNRKLEIIRDQLMNFQLKLVKSKGSIWIDGYEENKRKFISYLLTKETEGGFNTSITYFEKHFTGIDIDYIRTLTLNTINEYHYQIKKDYLHSLLTNIYITLYRSRNTKTDFKESSLEYLRSTDEFKISKDICEKYSATWNYKIHDAEISFLASILHGQLIPTESDKMNNSNRILDNEEFVNEIEAIVKKTFNYYKIDQPSMNFIHNFSLHVDGLIKRALNNNNAPNDLLENLKINCPFIYDVSVNIAKKISTRFHINIPDEEIGFIAIHIGIQIENNSNFKNKVNILLLTSNYRDITSMIKNKLIELYDNSVVLFDRLEDYESNYIDLIITNKAQNVLGKKTITISPFFNEKDQRSIDSAIAHCISKKEKDFQDIMLNTFFKEKLFFRFKESFSKEEAIKFLCDELYSQKIIDENFIDSVFERENSSSTCFFNSFAIPHAFEFVGKKTRFAILISDEGIRWDDKVIHLVLLMSIKLSDRRIFMSIYNTIIQTLQNKEKIEELIKSNNLKEFISILRGE